MPRGDLYLHSDDNSNADSAVSNAAEDGFVAPRFTAIHAMADEALSTLPNVQSHRRDVRRFKRAHPTTVMTPVAGRRRLTKATPVRLPVTNLIHRPGSRVAATEHYEDQLDNLISASREIKRMAHLGSTAARIGQIKDPELPLTANDKRYSSQVYAHDRSYVEGDAYETAGQRLATAERLADYRRDYKAFWKAFDVDDVVDSIERAPSRGVLTLTRRGPPGFDPALGHRKHIDTISGKTFYVMGRDPPTARSFDTHVKFIIRADGKRGHDESWLFPAIARQNVVDQTTAVQGYYYAGPLLPLGTEAGDNSLGEVPAGARLVRGDRGDVLFTPPILRLRVLSPIRLDMTTIKHHTQYVLFESQTPDHVYGGPDTPLGRSSYVGLHVPVGTVLLREIFPGTGRRNSRQHLVRDSILLVPSGPVPQPEQLRGDLVASEHRVLRKVPIDFGQQYRNLHKVPIQPLLHTQPVEANDFTNLLQANTVNRNFTPDNRSFLDALRINLQLPNTDYRALIKRALLQVHPDKSTNHDQELLQRLYAVRARLAERTATG